MTLIVWKCLLECDGFLKTWWSQNAKECQQYWDSVLCTWNTHINSCFRHNYWGSISSPHRSFLLMATYWLCCCSLLCFCRGLFYKPPIMQPYKLALTWEEPSRYIQACVHLKQAVNIILYTIVFHILLSLYYFCYLCLHLCKSLCTPEQIICFAEVNNSAAILFKNVKKLLMLQHSYFMFD